MGQAAERVALDRSWSCSAIDVELWDQHETRLGLEITNLLDTD